MTTPYSITLYANADMDFFGDDQGDLILCCEVIRRALVSAGVIKKSQWAPLMVRLRVEPGLTPAANIQVAMNLRDDGRSLGWSASVKVGGGKFKRTRRFDYVTSRARQLLQRRFPGEKTFSLYVEIP